MDDKELALRDLEVFGPPANGRPAGVVVLRTEDLEPAEPGEDVWAAWTADESNLL